jgi:glutamine synthetase
MNTEEVIAYITENNIQKIKFAFADIDGILRGKVISQQKFLDGLANGYPFCEVVFGWDSTDTLYDDSIDATGWYRGYPDKQCFIDISTFRLIPWEDNGVFFLADFTKEGQQSLDICPRSLLKSIVADCENMGFSAQFAQEFEWFNFRETPQSLQQKGFTNLEPLSPGMYGYSILRPSQNSSFYHDLFDLLTKFGIPIEGLHTETGPGVYEAAIAHATTLEAADRAVLFKTAVKEIASKHGITATFMAKWNEHLPGCSGHIHQSLWTPDGTKNLFYDAADKWKMSELHKQYLAGQLFCLPHLLPMYAPTVNSYKRLVEGAWAPTTTSWGLDNRTTALRVIASSEKYTRLETRVPGADTNPYIAMSAALASGLYGIKNKLKLEALPTLGSAYGINQNAPLHNNLNEAAIAMKNSTVAQQLFGGFAHHFAQTRIFESRQYAKSVSDWELKRYFESI